VEQHVVDFDSLAGLELEIEIDDVFCTLGTTIKKAGSQEAFRRVDHDYVVALGRMASGLGAERVCVVSSLGADPDSRNFYLRVKGEMEEALKGLQLPHLAVFRPSLLTGDREELRPVERVSQILLKPVAPLLLGPLEKYRPVAAEQVAEAMRQVAGGEQKRFRVVESDEIHALWRRREGVN
jgi:uncharacterized protein YbjT (DUF2867 family)